LTDKTLIRRKKSLFLDLGKKGIDFAYGKLTKSITNPSKCLPESKFKKLLKPYWDNELENAHKT
jgi:hypothetical protein